MSGDPDVGELLWVGLWLVVGAFMGGGVVFGYFVGHAPAGVDVGCVWNRSVEFMRDPRPLPPGTFSVPLSYLPYPYAEAAGKGQIRGALRECQR